MASERRIHHRGPGSFGAMNETLTRLFAAAAVTGFAVLGVGVGMGGTAIAAASGMNINATGGDGTAIDKDGTQGDMKPAVQGTPDDDNDQDAWLHGSQEATPQFRATPK